MTDSASLQGRTLLIASHNAGKVREIAALLAPLGVRAQSAGALGLPEPEETEDTFIGNALLKARAAAAASGLPALSDDSGLCVDALKGAPGVLSARWAGPERDFALAMRAVREAMEASGSPLRSARFVCALAIVWPEGREIVVEGRVEGEIVWPPRGTQGFGYDPIFVSEGRSETFGEMDPAEKHRISHRADAFAQLLRALA